MIFRLLTGLSLKSVFIAAAVAAAGFGAYWLTTLVSERARLAADVARLEEALATSEASVVFLERRNKEIATALIKNAEKLAALEALRADVRARAARVTRNLKEVNDDPTLALERANRVARDALRLLDPSAPDNDAGD